MIAYIELYTNLTLLEGPQTAVKYFKMKIRKK